MVTKTEPTMNLTLNVWRQKNRNRRGQFETYKARDISTGHVVPRDARRGQREA